MYRPNRGFQIILTGLLAQASVLRAGIYHMDPEEGGPGGTGSAAQPWGGLEQVLKGGRSFTSGDTLLLHSGYHGKASLRGSQGGPAVVAPSPGDAAVISELSLSEVSGWTFSGLVISAEAAAILEKRTLVSIGSGANGNFLLNCRIETASDVSGWAAGDWVAKAGHGIQVSGSKNTIRGNTVRNVAFGISVSGEGNSVEGNLVENFSGDGLRGLGDDNLFAYNTVRNAYKVDDNHDDGFQSWSRGPDGKVGGGVVRGMVLRGNI